MNFFLKQIVLNELSVPVNVPMPEYLPFDSPEEVNQLEAKTDEEFSNLLHITLYF